MTLPKLNALLTEKLGPDWFDLEIETISLALLVVLDEMTWQKIALLKVLRKDARSFESKLSEFDAGLRGTEGLDDARISTDPVFAIHACDIINNIEVEPAVIAMPTALEFAYALKVLSDLPIDFNPASSELWNVMCESVLKEEGIDRPLGPFNFVSASKFGEPTKDEDEVKAINVAIAAYVNMMEAGEGEARVNI